MRSEVIVNEEFIQSKIHLIRGQKVMLDSELAKLYGVPTFRLNEAVKRNLSRFPGDFMYLLIIKEVRILISQSAISSWGGRRKLPYVFTEQGVAMLSTVLNSERAVRVNIAIMRTFVKLRQIFAAHKELSKKLEQLEHKIERHDEEIHSIFEAIRGLMAEPEKPKRRIGFHPLPVVPHESNGAVRTRH